MDDKILRSKSWVANYFYSKICEYQHHLDQVVRHCDNSLVRFKTKLPPLDNEGRLLTYSYGALTNTVQTLKDAGSVFLPKKITWGDIKKLHHGEFFYLSRNASTHDGNPIINAWIDGMYYVSNDIERFDGSGSFIVINRPEVDVRKFTLEFSLGFYKFLLGRLELLGNAPDLSVPIFGPDELEKFMGSSIIPDDAKKVFLANREEIMRGATRIKVNSIANALEEIRTGIQYSQLALS